MCIQKAVTGDWTSYQLLLFVLLLSVAVVCVVAAGPVIRAAAEDVYTDVDR